MPPFFPCQWPQTSVAKSDKTESLKPLNLFLYISKTNEKKNLAKVPFHLKFKSSFIATDTEFLTKVSLFCIYHL